MERQSFVQPSPVFEDERLVAVADLQAVFVAQFQADLFLLLVECQSFVQPSPSAKNESLVTIISLQRIFDLPIISIPPEDFFLPENMKCYSQFANSFCAFGAPIN